MAYRVDDGGGGFTTPAPVPTWMYPPAANPAPVTPPSTLGVAGAPYVAPVTPPTEAIAPTQPRVPNPAVQLGINIGNALRYNTPMPAPNPMVQWGMNIGNVLRNNTPMPMPNPAARFGYNVGNALLNQTPPPLPNPAAQLGAGIGNWILGPNFYAPSSSSAANPSPVTMPIGGTGGEGTYRPATTAAVAPRPGEPNFIGPVNQAAVGFGTPNTSISPTVYPAGYLPTPLAGGGAPATTPPAAQAVMPSRAVGGIPAGVDPAWWNAFMAEHEGKTPLEVYYGDDALEHALYDKAWGEQFARTYNRAPSLYDWKASYGTRQAGYYYGGGGGGGGGSNTNAAGLPLPYSAAFASAFGMTPDTYYTADRGGSEQAANDYQSIVYYWQNKVGWSPTQEDLARTLSGFGAWARAQRQPLTMAGYRSYLDLVLNRPGTEPSTNLATLNMGEM